MRSRAIVQICLQLNQMNSKCQITSILIQLDYNALLEVQYWVGRIKFTLIPQRVSTNSNEVQQKACLVLFSSFCADGAGLTCWVHSHQVLAQSSSRLTHTIDSFHRVNLLYNRTINCFSTLAQSSTALNETFNYKQALQEPDYHKFVKAMMNKVDDHESQVHWTLTKRCDIPPGTKTIMSIWSFKHKQHPDGTLNKHKACLCAHGGMLTWGQNYWEMYAPVAQHNNTTTGQAFASFLRWQGFMVCLQRV
jgi:hypothetical protein